MACERNRINKFVDYIESLGITINLGRNKARGNKGFFKAGRSDYRIDISKNLTDFEVLKVLVHEFVHYIHYKSDKTLKSAEFLFGDNFEAYEEDLITLTVESLPKASVSPIFDKINVLKSEISEISGLIKSKYSDFKLSEAYKPIEDYLKKTSCKYLLKYDKVKVFEGFKFKLYTVENIEKDFPMLDIIHCAYIKLQSKRRALRRLNSRVSKLNKYYNNKSELIARSFEYYVTNPDFMKSKTPKLYNYYNEFSKNCGNKLLNDMLAILS